MEMMEWNHQRLAYEGMRENGRRFWVDGDEWSEALHEYIAEHLADKERVAWMAFSKEERRDRVQQEIEDESPLYQEAVRYLLDPANWEEGVVVSN